MQRIAAVLTSIAVIGAAATGVSPAAAAPASAVGSSSATAPNGQISISLLDAPVSERADPRARVYIIDQLRPGAKIVRRVKVTNGSNATQSISAYAGPAAIAHGSLQFGNSGSSNELTSWTTVAPSTLKLWPGQAGDATVTVVVPEKATNSERYAVIWAQVASKSGAGQTTEVNRVGVRMYLDVFGGSALQTSSFRITDLSGSRAATSLLPIVTAHVRNTGQRALDLTGTLRLGDGPSGLSAGPFNTQQPTTIAPGKTTAVVFTLGKQLPDGPWRARLNLASGLTRGSATATIVFRSPAPPVAKAAAKAPHHASSFPWWLVIAGVVALVAGLLLWLFWRRRRRDEEDRDAVPTLERV